MQLPGSDSTYISYKTCILKNSLVLSYISTTFPILSILCQKKYELVRKSLCSVLDNLRTLNIAHMFHR